MYPWFLLGLLGISIPVIIHLLELRKPQRILFTNTAFIKEVELVTMRRNRLQSLLILLARMLAIVALVLVFCQPFISADEKGSVGQIDTAVLVDNTFSMQAVGNTQAPLLESAVDEAKAVGGDLGSGNRIAFVNSNGAYFAPEAYRAKLDELKLSAQASVSQLLGSATERAQSNSSLYVISDFQKSGLGDGQLKDLGKGQRVVLAPISPKQQGNIYVDSLWLDDAFVRIKTNVGLYVRLRNGGNLAVSSCPVKVFLGNRQVGAFQVSIEPGKTVTSEVQVQLMDDKLMTGRVVTEDRPVTFDNAYYFTLRPAAAIRILEIGVEPVARQLYGNEPLFSYSFSSAQQVDYGDMRRANMVLLNEVSGVSAGLREGLLGVVKRGGTVVVVSSPLTKDRVAYENLFRDLGIGRAQWNASDATPELREVAMPNSSDPFFREVFGAQNRTVTLPRVAPVLRWSRTGNDVLRMRDGDSYLANFTRGAGQIFVFSAPFAKEYSDFVTHAFFVPVMYRMAMLSYRDEQLPAYRLTQDAVTLKIPMLADANQADEASFRLVQDSLTLIPAQRVVGQDVRLEVPVGMNQAGFYQVQQKGKLVTTLAFNQDKRESELAAYSAEELRQIVGPNNPNVRVLDGGIAGSQIAQLRAEQTGQPLWRYFLLLALICLLAEALLVRFGAKQRAATKATALT
ncbi:MAG TPA: BatA domain-containing protein [Hymenobacter sp.]|uniref:BatA domain-containing protein n=1 Tax=Hymenobacter sp. TaxID=1898978 RepID=UPI002EDA86E1